MAEIYYRGDASPQIHSFEELRELHDIVEFGPDWNEIEKIEIHLNTPSREPLPDPVDTSGAK
jgi:hypothetical protein